MSRHRTDFALSEYILNATFCIQCGVFAFSHDTLKERIALAMVKMLIYGIYIFNIILVTSSLCSYAK